MSTSRLLPLTVAVLAISLSAPAQINRPARTADRVTERVQQRVDSLRKTMTVRQDQDQVYHDSVLQYLQTRRGDGPPRPTARHQAKIIQRGDPLAYHDSVLQYLQARVDRTAQPPDRSAAKDLPKAQSMVLPLPARPSAGPLPPVASVAPHFPALGAPPSRQPLLRPNSKSNSIEKSGNDEPSAATIAQQKRMEAWATHLWLGSYLQLYRQPRVGVDISPFMGYHFTPRWSVGVGVSYRVPYTVPLYQVRAFGESTMPGGIVLHAAYERGWQPQPGDRGESIITRQYLLAGVGKTYRIAKNVRGTTLLLFRPGPRAQRLDLPHWNVRTGVYLSQ